MREVEEKRIIDAAFDVFVREKIEVASMAEDCKGSRCWEMLLIFLPLSR